MVADLLGLAGAVLGIAQDLEVSVINASEAGQRLDAALTDFRRARADALEGVDADRAALVERLRKERAARDAAATPIPPLPHTPTPTPGAPDGTPSP